MKASPCAVSNIAAFGVKETRRMLSAASPASRRPGLRLLRASFGGYVCAASSEGMTMDARDIDLRTERMPGLRRMGEPNGSSTFERLSGNPQTPNALLVWQLSNQLPHDADLRGLRGHDIVGEDIHVHFLAGAWRGKEVVDHLDGAFMMLDHE